MTLSELASPGDAIDYLVGLGWRASEAVEFVDGLIKIAKGKRRVPARPSLAPKQVKRQFPDDFVLNPDLVKFAADRGFARPEVDTMWIKFKNYHHAKGSLSANWPASWRTWVMNAVDYRNRDQRSRAPDLIDGRL